MALQALSPLIRFRRDEAMQCRICFEEGGPVLSPCNCRGTAAYIHRQCLDRYIQHYPDRVCRVCRTEFSIPRAFHEILGIVVVFFILNLFLMLSRERLLVKGFLMTLVWMTLYYYSMLNLLNGFVYTMLSCLWMVFLPGGDYKAIVSILVILGGVSFLYTLFRFIPSQYVLNFIAILLGYSYVAFLTLMTLTTADSFTFTIYMSLTFLVWNAFLYPVRLNTH